eukprot:TRINITY_DN13134_c0_g1_i1.p1 TRINITY_DN13134_c0_g1~~TRINITY_DN13134_c0_g1_i1.p1  ORF type:complete len:123 (+),score=19.07 TRINITY_DN13134_c0_g1_i1:583-951(+)
MNELIMWANDNEDKVHPVHLSAVLHYNFVRIHPFADGNGRVGRLLGNIALLRNSFTPAVIYPKDKNEYISTLATGHQKQDLTPFTTFIAKALLSSQRELIQDRDANDETMKNAETMKMQNKN